MYSVMAPGFGEQSSLMRSMLHENYNYKHLINLEATDGQYSHNTCLVSLSEKVADRLRFVIDVIKVTFHVGFLPLVIYLGWAHGPDMGNPPFSITNFLWFY